MVVGDTSPSGGDGKDLGDIPLTGSRAVPGNGGSMYVFVVFKGERFLGVFSTERGAVEFVNGERGEGCVYFAIRVDEVPRDVGV